jgi:uncharacterized protein (TIGR03435 family)
MLKREIDGVSELLRLLVSGTLVFLFTPSVVGQSPGAPEVFEAVSIKKPPPGGAWSKWAETPGGIDYNNVNLGGVIQRAFGVRSEQVVGPAWLSTDYWVIIAKMPHGGSEQQIPLFTQALLRDRFDLVAHHELKEGPIYALVAAKGGTKLHQAKEIEPLKRIGSSSGGMAISGKVTMPMLVAFLSQQLDRPVIDMSAAKGAFEIALEWAPREGERGGRAASGDNSPLPSIFTAIQEKLGLRLDARKGPIDTIIVDHINRQPTEN